MGRYVALLRAVNVGKRRVGMGPARDIVAGLGCTDVTSFVNSGNLIFTGTGGAAAHERRIRAALEDEFGFEITTFVRSAAQVRTLVEEHPFGTIAAGHTHFVLFTSTRLTAVERTAVERMANDHDELIIGGRDVHWLIHAKSTETTLGPKQWRDALPDNPSTARNITMLTRLVSKL